MSSNGCCWIEHIPTAIVEDEVYSYKHMHSKISYVSLSKLNTVFADSPAMLGPEPLWVMMWVYHDSVYSEPIQQEL